MVTQLPEILGGITAIVVSMLGTVIFQHVRAWLNRQPGYWHRRVA